MTLLPWWRFMCSCSPRIFLKSVLSSFQMRIFELSPAACISGRSRPHKQAFVYLASDPLLPKSKEKRNELGLRKTIWNSHISGPFLSPGERTIMNLFIAKVNIEKHADSADCLPFLTVTLKPGDPVKMLCPFPQHVHTSKVGKISPGSECLIELMCKFCN